MPTSELPAGATRHPWNQTFAWSLPDTAPATISATERSGFDRDGFLVLREVIDPSTVAALRAELDELEAEVEQFLAEQRDGRLHIAEAGAITFTVHAVLRSAAARAFAKHPALVGLCRDLIGPDVNLYWDQAVYKKPDKPRRFPWHQDTGYTFVEPQHYLTCWIALTDVTIANGCPWILPRVHRAGTLLHHWVDPIGWECLPADPPSARSRRKCRPGARWCSPRSRRTSPGRTPPTRSARRTSCSTRGGDAQDRRRLASRCGAIGFGSV